MMSASTEVTIPDLAPGRRVADAVEAVVSSSVRERQTQAAEARILRLVMGGMLTSLLWKLTYYVMAFDVYARWQLVDEFFPVWLQNRWVLATSYLVAVISLIVGLFEPTRIRCLACTAVAAAATAILCVHQMSYNDVTFLTVFWVAVWALWFSLRWGRESTSTLVFKGVFLSHLILAVVMLGGAVGKMTPGYWSGEVFYEIYFRERAYWPFQMLRSIFEEGQLRSISMFYSRFVIVAEAGCSLLWLCPPRLASTMFLVVLAGIIVLSNPLLVSVMASLMALALVGLFFDGSPAATPNEG
jgi:hypothetical protein